MPNSNQIDISDEDHRKIFTLDKGHLLRLVGIRAIYAIGYGDVGSSIYYALGVTALYAMGAAPLAIAAAGLVFVFTVLTYAELSAALPEAGGSSTFARRAFNSDGLSFVAGWALLLDYVVTIAISAYTVPPYLAHFFPVFRTPAGHFIAAAVLIALLTFLNIVGIKESTTLSLILAIFGNVTQVALIVLGFVAFVNLPTLISQFTVGVHPTWGQFVYGVTIAMVAYTGIEAISQMSGEVKNPGKNVPRGMMLTMFTVLFMYMGIVFVAISAMPFAPGADGVWASELTTTYLEDPIAGIAARMPAFGKYLAPWVAILGAAILTIATNAGVIGASRLTYSMGGRFQLPAFFSRLHRRFKTPYLSLITFSGISVAIIFLGKKLTYLADLYNFGAMLAFALAHASLLGLRWREPHLPRPFKLKPNIRIRGREYPLTAILGFVFISTVWVTVVITHPFGRTMGFIWMFLGLGMYYWYRRRSKIPAGKAIDVEEVAFPEYCPFTIKKVLLAVKSLHRCEVADTAFKIAKEDHATVVALNVIEMPPALPVETFLYEKFSAAEDTLHKVWAVGTEHGIHVETRLLQSRHAGETICEVAREVGADVIVIGSSERWHRDLPFPTTTVEYVLKNAPCLVWVASVPS
jgi:APA family basic amino acid/polyamine antiporter